jgi:CrcB protein
VTSDEPERPLPHDPDLEVDEGPEGEPRPPHLTPQLIGLAFAGGSIGVLLRALLEFALPDGSGFPTTTFAINITGALFLAVLIEWLARRGPDEGGRRRIRLFLGTGVMGGFTTYSALAAQIDALARTDQPFIALLYGVGTIVAGFAASVAGVVVMRRELSR